MTRTRAALAAAIGATVLAYYVLRLESPVAWAAEAVYVIPPAIALAFQWRRARSAAGASALFWRLLAAGAFLWMLGALVFTASFALRGGTLGGVGPIVLHALFFGSFVPLLAALALDAAPGRRRTDAVTLADTALALIAVSFLFVRIGLLPRLAAAQLEAPGTLRLGINFLVAAWAVVLWERTEDREWRRVYGCLAAFATLYGALVTAANAIRDVRAPGHLLDLAWMVPFFVLAAGTLPPASPRKAPGSGAWVILLAGPGPFLVDLALDAVLPELAGHGHASHLWLLLATSALLAVTCAVRLSLQEKAEEAAVAVARSRADEERRAVRLGMLAGVARSVVSELDQAMSDVLARTRDSAQAIGEKGDRALEQARRGREIVQALEAALRYQPAVRRDDIQLAPFLEETVDQMMERGLGLHVTLSAAPDLPMVRADAPALQAAVHHLVRNAAQAAPGGNLRITAEGDGSDLVLRFQDDGPGVPEEIRPRIFDPFFTTRRVGEGVGLGLTLVHFVARDHGGRVALEAAPSGAVFALRLPMAAEFVEVAPSGRWSLAGSVLVSAVLATFLAVLPEPDQHLLVRGAIQAASAGLAAAALGWIARRRRGRERWFWIALATGPLCWAATSLAGAFRPPSPTSAGAWFLVAAAADWAWAAALLLRPDPRARPAAAATDLLGLGAALCLYAYFYLYLVVLPLPFVAQDPTLWAAVLWARVAQRLGVFAWVAVLAVRTRSPYWRQVFRRLAPCFGLWTLGHGLASLAGIHPEWGLGALADAGWIVPDLVLAGAAVALAARPAPPPIAVAGRLSRPLWNAAALAALGALPLFDWLSRSAAHPALDSLREGVTRSVLVVVGLALAWREVAANRQAAAERARLAGTQTRLVDATRRSRLVESAIHELAGHLSGIGALTRLVRVQPELSARIREDVARIQQKAEAALRVARNLVASGRPLGEHLTSLAVNDLVREVAELRGPEIAAHGVALALDLADALPPIAVDAAALRQVLLELVDNARVAVKAGGHIQIQTRSHESGIVLRVEDDGPGFTRADPAGVLGPAPGLAPSAPGLGLTMAREVVGRHGGTLRSGNRVRGGAEVEIQLPAAQHRSAAG